MNRTLLSFVFFFKYVLAALGPFFLSMKAPTIVATPSARVWLFNWQVVLVFLYSTLIYRS